MHVMVMLIQEKRACTLPQYGDSRDAGADPAAWLRHCSTKTGVGHRKKSRRLLASCGFRAQNISVLKHASAPVPPTLI